ncbi:hypothetical protein TNIN_220701, partial [Trichonephila inaurata madagascariensis]
SNIPEEGIKMEVDEDESGQDFDPGDSDQDSGASLSSCTRKKDRGRINVCLEDLRKKNQSPSAANLLLSPQKVSQSHSQRALNALRQQQKEAEKHCIAAVGMPASHSRIIMKSLPPALQGRQ